MSAPAKARGGARPIAPGSADATKGRPTTPAPERPPRGRSGGGTSKPSAGRRKPPKPPQGHGPIRQPALPSPKREGPPTYTNQSVKPDLLQTARRIAELRGYESLRISDLTEPVGVTRQAFYAHFRDKRHCLSEVMSPSLAAIERIAAAAEGEDELWASHVVWAIDEALSERFGSIDGTRGRILAAIGELLREGRTLHEITIGKIVKSAHIPQGDFYKQFSTKRECFCVHYEQLVGELIEEVEGCGAGESERADKGESGSAEPRDRVRVCSAEHTRHDLLALLTSLGERLAADPERLRILIVESAHLPESPDPDQAGAWRGSMTDAIAELISSSQDADLTDPRIRWLAASTLELVRSAALSSQADDLPEQLAGFGSDYAPSLLGGSEPLAA